MIKQQFLVLFCLALLISPSAWAAVDPLLEQAVQKLPPARRIDVTMLDGDRYLGTFAGIQSGAILLEYFPGPEGSARTASLPLADIVRLREERSGSRQGFSAGFTTGAVVGGSLSLLWGLVITSLNSQDDNTAGVVGFTMLGSLAGGIGLGTLGLGIGALADVWYTVYESPLAPALKGTADPGETRLGLGFGLASGYQKEEDYQEKGVYGQFGLQKPLGSHFELGPEIAYYDLDGTINRSTADYTYVQRTSAVLTVGLTGSYQSSRLGWAPYLIAGTGYYISGGEYLGLSLGGGLRYRTKGHQDMKIEIRDHLSIYDDGHDFRLDYFVTLGANFSFGL